MYASAGGPENRMLLKCEERRDGKLSQGPVDITVGRKIIKAYISTTIF